MAGRYWKPYRDVAQGDNGGPSMEPEKAKIEAIDAVLHDMRYSQTEALVLIGLIVRSDEDFANAFPGGSTLAMYAKVKKRDAVFKALKSLQEEHKVIQRTTRANGQSNSYCVLPMHIIEAITAEYDALKVRKSAQTRPPQADRSQRQPVPLTGTAPSKSRPPNEDRFVPQPAPFEGASFQPTRPSKADTIEKTLSNRTLTTIDSTSYSSGDLFQKTESLPQPEKRGTRLPDDWALPEPWRVAALKRGLSQQQVESEAVKFHAHWVTKTGKDATKRRWDLTWVKWLENAIGYGLRPNGISKPHSAPESAQDRRDRISMGEEKYLAYKAALRARQGGANV